MTAEIPRYPSQSLTAFARAIEYSEAGGLEDVVETRVHETPTAYVEVRVRGTGAGPDVLAEIAQAGYGIRGVATRVGDETMETVIEVCEVEQ